MNPALSPLQGAPCMAILRLGPEGPESFPAPPILPRNPPDLWRASEEGPHGQGPPAGGGSGGPWRLGHDGLYLGDGPRERFDPLFPQGGGLPWLRSSGRGEHARRADTDASGAAGTHAESPGRTAWPR